MDSDRIQEQEDVSTSNRKYITFKGTCFSENLKIQCKASIFAMR